MIEITAQEKLDYLIDMENEIHILQEILKANRKGHAVVVRAYGNNEVYYYGNRGNVYQYMKYNQPDKTQDLKYLGVNEMFNIYLGTSLWK